MLQTRDARTRFYRVTDRDRPWPDVLSGAGSYFSAGGRYNRVHQKTVYVSEDPLVSIGNMHSMSPWICKNRSAVDH